MSDEENEEYEGALAQDPLEAHANQQNEDDAIVVAATAVGDPEADARMVNDLLGQPETVLGLELRPVTLASIALLKSAGSQLVDGLEIDQIDNVILDICIFLRIQTLPIKEAAKLCRDREELEDAALEFGDLVPPKDIPGVVESVTRILMEATETKVEPMSEKGEELDPGQPGES